MPGAASGPSGDPGPLTSSHLSSTNFSTAFPAPQSRRPRSNTTPTPRWTSPILSDRFHPDPCPLKQINQLELEHATSKSTTIGPIGQLRKRLSRPSLKREATSPVYLDENTISIPSIPCASRRVAPCMPSRLRGGDSDVASISSQDELEPKEKEKDNGSNLKEKKRRGAGQRNKWTKEETEALVRGCNTFAIGQWKAIRDNDPLLASRSPGDLKDRFRTYFPDAYRKHYPNAKTHISTRIRSVDSAGNSLFGEGAVRRERKQFSTEEDEALRKGYARFGTAWSSIQRDPILASRKATDLRDRFRNAFPDLYAAAGYKSRPRKASASDILYLPIDCTGTSGQHGTFEAMDVPGHSPYLNRSLSQTRPEQVVNRYDFPSLDFLKTHGADAFSDFRVIYGVEPAPAGDYDTSDRQLSMGAIPNHLTNNTTPRPNLTPRPNDTTPRPKLALMQDLSVSGPGDTILHECEGMREGHPSLAHAPTQAAPVFRSLHKTQSSMDLSQFSNLHLVDAHHIISPTSSQFSTGGFHALEQFDFNSGEAISGSNSPYLGGSINYSSPDILDVPESSSHAGGSIENCFFPMTSTQEVSPSSEWLPDFDIASQTYPSAFGVVGQGIMNMADAQSSVSSFHSSRSSMSGPLLLEEHDRVLYTAVANHPGFFEHISNPPNGISGTGSGAHETLYPGPDPTPMIPNDQTSLPALFNSELVFDENDTKNSTAEGGFSLENVQ